MIHTLSYLRTFIESKNCKHHSYNSVKAEIRAKWTYDILPLDGYK
jgi:hypothetical protein